METDTQKSLNIGKEKDRKKGACTLSGPGITSYCLHYVGSVGLVMFTEFYIFLVVIDFEQFAKLLFRQKVTTWISYVFSTFLTSFMALKILTLQMFPQ